MTLPAQVLAQRDKAKQMQEELGKPPANPDNPQNEDNPPGTATAEPVASEAPPPPPEVDWKQRYLSLQGMFNSQVPKLQADLKAANQQIAELRQTIETRAAPAASATPKTYLTEKDLEDFDKDTIDVMRRAAREEAEGQFAPIIAQLQQQISALQTTVVPKMTQIERDTTANKVDKFYNSLDQIVPQWRQLNNDNNFLDWLDEIDPLTGKPRQEFLDEAVSAGDANRASKFFAAYLQTISVPPVPPTPATTPVTPPALEALVSPGKGRGGAPPAEKQPVSREFIAKFYDDVRMGKYRGRTEEKAKIEADIFAAQREGRVT